jgi:putative sigma-54 modulation protein
MQINVTFRHIEPSDALRSYAEEKIARARKHLEEPVEAHVTLKVEKFRHIAEVTIDANGSIINGAEETDDMYSAIDLVADNIENQIRKNKEKQRDRKSGNSRKGFAAAAMGPDAVEPEEEDAEPQIVRSERYYAKPMDIDEAVMQLKISADEFIVFTNRSTSRINVLYRRKDGRYGLIEPLA